MKFDGVIFDLDGTLLDSLADIATATNLVLAESGVEGFSVDRYRTLVGDGVRVLFERAAEAAEFAYDDEWLVSQMERFVTVYRDVYTRESQPYRGIDAMLIEIERRRLARAVLSNKPHHLTLELVEHFFARTSFSPVFGQRLGVPRKPDPTAVEEIMSTWQLAPGRIAYVGDTNIDMLTAVASGCFAVGVTWGFRSEEELRSSGADAIVHTAAELTELLLA